MLLQFTHQFLASTQLPTTTTNDETINETINEKETTSSTTTIINEKESTNENNSLSLKSPIVSHFVMNYGERSIFSQSFIARIDSQLPFMENQLDTQTTIQILYSFISKEMEKIIRFQNKNK